MQPIPHVDKRPLYLDRQDIVVLQQDSRIIMAKIDHAIWKACLVVAHARDAWWRSFTALLRDFDDGTPIYVMIDANAAPGRPDQSAVGIHGSTESKNTPLFRQFLEDFALCLPSTFPCHHGSRETSISPQGTSSQCIDYVCVPRAMLPSCQLSRTVEEFDLLNGEFDHALVALQLCWHDTQRWNMPSDRSGPAAKFDRNSISREIVAATIAQIKAPSWDTDIATHFENYNHVLLHGLSQCCSKPPRGPKKPFFTTELWALRNRKIQAKKQLSAVRRRQRHELLSWTFRTWVSRQSSSIANGPENFLYYASTLMCWRL